MPETFSSLPFIEHIFQHHILFSYMRIPSATRWYHTSTFKREFTKDAHQESFSKPSFR